MQAKILKTGDVTVIQLTGRLKYEMVEPFRNTCQDNFLDDKLIFDLSGLDFVGSNGITCFVDAIRELAKQNTNGIKMCRLRTEYEKIFTAGEIGNLQIYENESEAVRAFSPVVVEEPAITLEPIELVADPDFRSAAVDPVIPPEMQSETQPETQPETQLETQPETQLGTQPETQSATQTHPMGDQE